MPPTTERVTGAVRVGRDGQLVTVAIAGALDPNTGVELLAAVQAALEQDASRIDVDLLGVTSFTPEGARSLRRARSLARGVADGLHYRTAGGPGHEALLEAFADDGEDTGPVPRVTPADLAGTEPAGHGNGATPDSTADGGDPHA